MLKIEKSITVDAPVEQVFAYMSDPTHIPEYQAGVARITNLERLPSGGSRFKALTWLLGLRLETTNQDIEFVPNERVVETTRGAGIDGTTSTRFERLAGDKTRVTLVSEFAIPGGPLAKVNAPFLAKYAGHSVEMALEAAKARIEAKAPATIPG